MLLQSCICDRFNAHIYIRFLPTQYMRSPISSQPYKYSLGSLIDRARIVFEGVESGMYIADASADMDVFTVLSAGYMYIHVCSYTAL